jgi:type IV pilus secretin PilQ/predicted competence protein
MKIRLARIRGLAVSKGKGAVIGIIFSLLAFTVAQAQSSKNSPETTPAVKSQQSTPANASSNGTLPAKNLPADAVSKNLPFGSITDIQTAREGSNLIITVKTDRLIAPQEFMLPNPPRLVLDLPNTENKLKFTQMPINTVSVRQLRVNQFQASDPKIARLVVDLEDNYGKHEVLTDSSSIRVTFYPGASDSVPAAQKDASAPNTKEPSEEKKIIIMPKKPAPALARDLPKSEFPPVALDLRPEPKPISPAPVVVNPVAAAATTAVANPVAVASATVVDNPPAGTAAPVVANPVVIATPPVVTITPPRQFPPSPSSSEFHGQPLTLDLVDVSLVDFFRLMAEEGGINIILDPEVKGNLSIKVVKTPWDEIFEMALANNGLAKRVQGSIVRIARRSTLQDEAKQQEALKKASLLAADLETRVKRLNYAKATSFTTTLADQKTVRGTVVVDERSNSLIITDIPSSVEKLMQLVESLDIPQSQVEIEARIISANRDFARDIGVQFGFVEGNLERVTVGGPNTFSTIGGYRPSQTPDSAFIAGNKYPNSGRGASSTSASEGASISTGTTDNNKGNYNVNLPSLKPFGGIGVSIGNIFDTFLLDAAITAGEQKGKAKLISQPKVTAQNNSVANIKQGFRIPFQVISNNTVSIHFFDATLTLNVTPQITYEGNVVLDLKVENNSLDFTREIGGLPAIRISESSTRILVTDGGTTVIGGILIDNDSSSEQIVPGLGTIPVLGNLFRRHLVDRTTQEVLFFITPRVIK